MRKICLESGPLKNITFIIAGLVVLAAFKNATAQHYVFQEPTKSFNISFRAFDRPNEGDRQAVAVNQVSNQAVLLNNDVSELGGGLGPDISYIFGSEYACKYEVRGFFINWDNQNSRSGANITSPLIPGASFQRFQTDYNSEMFSIELNQRNDLTDYFTSILGVRYLSLNEQLDFVGSGTLAPPNPPLPLTVTSTTETKNPLLGLQAGGETRFMLTQGIHMDATVKGGIYSNSARQSNVSGTNFTPGVSRGGSNNDVTLLGEFSLRLHYDLIVNHMSAFIGYDAIYLQGVAIAPRNVQLNTGIDDQENIGFNGINFGLRFLR